MKFKISRDLLFSTLSKIAGLVPSNPVLPLGKHILMESDTSDLILKGGELSFQFVVRINNALDGSSDFSVSMEFKKLLDTLKTLESQDLSFKEKSTGDCITVKHSKGTFHIPYQDGKHYFKVHDPYEGDKVFKMQGSVLKDSIEFAAPFTKPVAGYLINTNGIYFTIKRNKVHVVACDMFKLAEVVVDPIEKPLKSEFIIVKDMILKLSKVLEEEKEVLVKKVDDKDGVLKNIIFTQADFNGSYSFIVQPLADRYPNYVRLFEEKPILFKISRSLLMEAIKRAMIFAPFGTKVLNLKFSQEEMEISSVNLFDSGSAIENIPIETKAKISGACNIVIPGSNIMAAISKMNDSDYVVFGYKSKSHSASICPEIKGEIGIKTLMQPSTDAPVGQTN